MREISRLREKGKKIINWFSRFGFWWLTRLRVKTSLFDVTVVTDMDLYEVFKS